MSEVSVVETPVQKLWSAGGYYTSLDRSKPENKMVIYRCMENCSSKVSDLINAEIEIANIFAHKVELVNEATGELGMCVRTVLVTPEGVTIECVSGGIERCVKAMMIAFGDPPWNPPMRCTILQEQIDKTKRTFKLKLHEVTSNGTGKGTPSGASTKGKAS